MRTALLLACVYDVRYSLPGRVGVPIVFPVGQVLQDIRRDASMKICPVYKCTGGHMFGSRYPGPIGMILAPLSHSAGHPRVSSLPHARLPRTSRDEAHPVRIDSIGELPRHRVAGGGVRGRHPAQRDAAECPRWHLAARARRRAGGNDNSGVAGTTPNGRQR